MTDRSSLLDQEALVQRAIQTVPLPSLANRLSMRQFLASDQAGLALVYQLHLDIFAVKDSLANVDFSSPEGPLKAVEIQGRIKGLNRAIDLMVEIANHEEAGDA